MSNDKATNKRMEGTFGCACGLVTGEPCAWAGPATDTVIVEWMPEHLRAAHKAAGNNGSYPSNGAWRLRVEARCAESILDANPNWAHVVR